MDTLVLEMPGADIAVGDRVAIRKDFRPRYARKRTTGYGETVCDFVDLDLVVIGADLDSVQLAIIHGDTDPLFVDRRHVDKVDKKTHW